MMTSPTRIAGARDPLATHSRILDSATLEFSKHGLAGARVERIAASAGCNKQLIYHYFSDKQGLYDAVQGRMVELARASIERERAKGVPYLESNVFEGPEFDRNEWARLQLWDGLTGAVDNAYLNSMRSGNFELLRDWIRSDQEAGLITSESTADQVLALVVLARLVPFAMPNVFRGLIGHDGSLEGPQSWLALVRRLLEPRVPDGN
jgi:AcrR family transcriptional regulator